MRAQCDRDSHAQVYLLLILKTLDKLGKNVWRSMAMQGLDPNRISTYVLGVLVSSYNLSLIIKHGLTLWIHRHNTSLSL